MEIKLKHIAPIDLIVDAIRQCYDSGDLSDSKWEDVAPEWENSDMYYVLGPKDKALIQRIIKSGHESTLEHCQITFEVKGFSRAVLQELARHRIGTSLSVKSTRYTLKELKDEESFLYKSWDKQKARAEKYLVMTGNDQVDAASISALERLRLLVASGLPNDYTKFCMPESYKVDAIITMNVRSLRHFLILRKVLRALWEIRNLANGMEAVIPEEYLFMFEDTEES